MLPKFLQEIALLRDLSHPNIVQHIGVWHSSNKQTPVLLMDLLDTNLTKFLKDRCGSILPYRVQVNICHDIAIALRFLHNNGVIHRDLSSNNILLVITSLKAKLSDFGMATVYDPNFKNERQLTKVPGTNFYMPPEAFKDRPDYTEKLDCFSLGVVIIQILTTLYPAPGDRCESVQIDHPKIPSGTTEVPIRERVRRKTHIDMIDSSNPLLDIALKCIEDEPRIRPSAKEVSERTDYLKKSPKYSEGKGTVAPSSVNRSAQGEVETPQEYNKFGAEVAGMNKQHSKPVKNLIETKAAPLSHPRKDDNIQETIEKDPPVKDIEKIASAISGEKGDEQCTAEFEGWDVMKQELVHSTKVGKLPQELNASRSTAANKGVDDLAPKFRWSKGTQTTHKINRCTDAVLYGDVVYILPDETREIFSYHTVEKDWSFIYRCEYIGSSLTIINNYLTTVGGKRTDIGFRYPVNSTAGYSSSFTDKLLSLKIRGCGVNPWVEEFPSMPTRRAFATAINTKTNLIVAGGIGGAVLKTVEIMNIETRQWMTAADLPQKVWGASAALCGNKLYLLGGLDGTFITMSCNLESLLFSCEQKSFASRFTSSLASRVTVWRTLENAPVTKSTCATFCGSLLAAGGQYSDEQPSNRIYWYDQSTGKWKKLLRMPTARYCCFAISYSDKKILIIGGKSSQETDIKEVDIAEVS